MRSHTLALAVASVALSTAALNGSLGTRVIGQVPASAPVAAPVAVPPFLSAPSNAPVVTPSNAPVAAPSNAPLVTPTTSPVIPPSASVVPGNSATVTQSRSAAAVQSNPAIAPTNSAVVDQDDMLSGDRNNRNTATGGQAVPAGSTIDRDDVRTRRDRDDMMTSNGVTGTGTLQGTSTTQQSSSGNTATGEQPIPGTTLDRDDIRTRRDRDDRGDNDADDMMLHNRGEQAIPSGSRLDRDDLSNNGTVNGTNSSVNSLQGTTGTGTSQLQGVGTTQTTGDLGGAPGIHRFVDPTRHNAFQPMTPGRTTPVTPNSSGSAAPAQPVQPGNAGK